MAQNAQPNDGAQQPLLADETEADYGATNGGHGTEGTSPAPPQTGGTFKRNLGAMEAFAIVISIVIGSGVFTSPGSIDANVPSPGAALLIWLVGGVLAWTGASTLAELGTAIPGEGNFAPQFIVRGNEPESLIRAQVVYSHFSSTFSETCSASWQLGPGSLPLCLPLLQF
jgi:solute carrier family 7 (L-type amino acid transporter), member 9/15